MMRALIVLAIGCGLAAAAAAQQPAPTLEELLSRLGAYVSSYGEKASVVVAVERYTQEVRIQGGYRRLRPRQLEAEFAIVKMAGGWAGFRDVVEVDGKPVHDRRDRLRSLLTDRSADTSEVTRIANESARFNVGPVRRNFNVPTTALFFFRRENHGRFTFERKGRRTIDGMFAWEIAFRETRTPTLIMTSAGTDVPVTGTLWVMPGDGTLVRSHLRMGGFSDSAQPFRRIHSEAEIDVTYRRPPGLDIWLPATMEESYRGAIIVQFEEQIGEAICRASYSDFKQFNTSIKIVP